MDRAFVSEEKMRIGLLIVALSFCCLLLRPYSLAGLSLTTKLKNIGVKCDVPEKKMADGG